MSDYVVGQWINVCVCVCSFPVALRVCVCVYIFVSIAMFSLASSQICAIRVEKCTDSSTHVQEKPGVCMQKSSCLTHSFRGEWD